MVVCPMPCVTLALPSSLLWIGAAAGRKEGPEDSPCSPSWWRLYLLCHQGTAEIRVPSVKLVLSGGKTTLEGTALGSPSLEAEGEDAGPLCCSRMHGTRALHQAAVPEEPDQLVSYKGEQTARFPSPWSFTLD